MNKLKIATVSFVLTLPILGLAGCGNEKVVTQDYQTGFRMGQLFTAYGSGLSGESACETARDEADGSATRSALSNSDGFEGCVAGFNAGLSSDAPNLGDQLN